MKFKSFTKTIIKSTFITSLIANILTITVLFIVCSSLISKIYNSQFKNSVNFISSYINEAIDTDIIYNNINSIGNNYSESDIKKIDSLIYQKEAQIDGLDIFFYKNNTDLAKILPTNYYMIYFYMTGLQNYKHSITIYSGDLYIVEIKKYGEYIYLQFFNATQSSTITNLYMVEGLLGYYYNNHYIYFDEKTVNGSSKNIRIKSSVNIPDLDLYYSNSRQITDNLVLFLTLLTLSIFRFLVTILNARRNIKKITKPLDKLVKNTEKLAANEATEKLNRFDYPYSEFKKVAEAFNKVLLSRELSEIKLFRSFEQMESVVHKRTRELITTNEQLTNAMVKAEEANALKSQFLANISHEIRTPLNCIIGFSDIILTEDHSSKVNVQVEQILHESETLLLLINDFLDYSKIDAGKMSIVHSEVDIRSLISSLLKSGQVQAGNKTLSLNSEINNSLPLLVMSDELRLYQIISNIFYNAIKFTPSGSVTIKVTTVDKKIESEKCLIFEIEDTGIGIPKESIGSIFNKFEQVDGSLTREYRGSGLGLTICKKIIELMKGTIEVDSEENRGSSFKITIPVEVQDIPINLNPTLPAITEDSEHREGSSILLVEDYPVNQIVAKKHLEVDNHIVTLAENGKEALDRCKERKFDLILMDLQMPVMDGFQATKEIRGSADLNNKTPILAMTANAMDTAKQTCLDAGMNGIITKPIRKVAFLKEVDKWLKTSNQ